MKTKTTIPGTVRPRRVPSGWPRGWRDGAGEIRGTEGTRDRGKSEIRIPNSEKGERSSSRQRFGLRQSPAAFLLRSFTRVAAAGRRKRPSVAQASKPAVSRRGTLRGVRFFSPRDFTTKGAKIFPRVAPASGGSASASRRSLSRVLCSRPFQRPHARGNVRGHEGRAAETKHPFPARRRTGRDARLNPRDAGATRAAAEIDRGGSRGGGAPRRTRGACAPRRSAGFPPAVSPTSSRPGVPLYAAAAFARPPGRLETCETADGKSALPKRARLSFGFRISGFGFPSALGPSVPRIPPAPRRLKSAAGNPAPRDARLFLPLRFAS